MCSLLKGLLWWALTPCATVKLLLTCWLGWMSAGISVPQKNLTFHVFLNQTGKLQFPVNPDSEKHFRKCKMASVQPFVWVLPTGFYETYTNFKRIMFQMIPNATRQHPLLPKSLREPRSLPRVLCHREVTQSQMWFCLTPCVILIFPLLRFHQCTHRLQAYQHLNSYFPGSLKAKSFIVCHWG